MSSHAYHPREGQPDEPILFDDCPRCDQIAANPIYEADYKRQIALYRAAIEAEHYGGRYNSQAEKLGALQMWRIALFIERFLSDKVNPWTLFQDQDPEAIMSASLQRESDYFM